MWEGLRFFSVHYEIIEELTLERNHTNVKIIGKPLIVPVLFKTMKTLIMESRPMNVRNVGEPSVVPVHSEYKKRIHTGEKPCECKLYGKALSNSYYVQICELLPETERKEYWKAFITQRFKDTRWCTPCKHEELGRFSVPFSWERTHSRENSVKYKQYMKTFICPTSLQNHVRMYTG